MAWEKVPHSFAAYFCLAICSCQLHACEPNQSSSITDNQHSISTIDFGRLTTYEFNLPPGHDVHVKLEHQKKGWMKLILWTPGDLTPRAKRMANGTLRLGTGNPES